MMSTSESWRAKVLQYRNTCGRPFQPATDLANVPQQSFGGINNVPSRAAHPALLLALLATSVILSPIWGAPPPDGMQAAHCGWGDRRFIGSLGGTATFTTAGALCASTTPRGDVLYRCETCPNIWHGECNLEAGGDDPQSVTGQWSCSFCEANDPSGESVVPSNALSTFLAMASNTP